MMYIVLLDEYIKRFKCLDSKYTQFYFFWAECKYTQIILNFICLYITFAARRDGVPVWNVDPAIAYRPPSLIIFITISINYWMHRANAKFLNNLHKATKFLRNNLVIK